MAAGAKEEKKRLSEATVDLSFDFERLVLAYVEYSNMLAECRDSNFEQGALIGFLNDKVSDLIGELQNLHIFHKE